MPHETRRGGIGTLELGWKLSTFDADGVCFVTMWGSCRTIAFARTRTLSNRATRALDDQVDGAAVEDLAAEEPLLLHERAAVGGLAEGHRTPG